jgi:hypothetical protein
MRYHYGPFSLPDYFKTLSKQLRFYLAVASNKRLHLLLFDHPNARLISAPGHIIMCMVSYPIKI